LDKRRSRGGDHKSAEYQAKSKAPDGGIDSRSASAKATAQTIGISPRKVERARTVLDNADPETREAVREGKKSINRAYQETQAKRKETAQVIKNESAELNHRQRILSQAWAELDAWRRKYQMLPELYPLFKALDLFRIKLAIASHPDNREASEKLIPTIYQ